jgi:tetratricopeptide (TPR) repeat protein
VSTARAIWSVLRRLLPALVVLSGYVVVALVMCRLPLFGVLGYESAFLFAILGSGASCHLAVVQVHRIRRRRADPLVTPLTPLGGVLGLYARVLGVNLLLLALPLDILSANAVHVPCCNYLAGLTWWFVLPMVSAAVATAWGVALGLLPLRLRWAVMAGYGVVLGSLVWGFVRFYAEAPVCQYDPFAGYFSGSLYDAHIEVTTSLVAARLYHLAGGLAVLLVAARFFLPGKLRLAWRPGERRRGLTVAALATTALVLGLYFAGGPLAYTVTSRNLAGALGGEHHTPHFVIHYPRGSLTPQELALHAADAEFRWHQLRRFYGVAPANKIRIYYFADDDQKRRLYGAADVDMAKPWRLEVYLTLRSFPHPVLKHELAHAFSAVFGDPAFGVSFRWGRALGFFPVPLFNPGLIEGSAVAADWRTRSGMTRHQWARAVVVLGKAPPLRAIMGYGFLASSAGRSYTLAGSFCRFLVERHGPVPFRRVFRNGGDFRAAYGRSLGQLEAQWKKFLRTVPLSARELALARERFRPRPVFERPCIHEIARLDRIADRQVIQGRHGAAARTYRRMCRFDPGSPGHLLGLVYAEAEQDHEGVALAAAQRLWGHPATTPPIRARTLWLLGNQAWRRGRLDRARELFAGAARFSMSEGAMRDLTVRRMALDVPALERSLRPLLAPAPNEPPMPNGWLTLAKRHPQLGVAQYLAGSYLLSHGAYRAAAAGLRKARALGLPDDRFRREALWRLGRAYLLAFELDKARETFTRLTSPAESQAIRSAALDWIERTDFWARHGRDLGLGKRSLTPQPRSTP